jgi:hypothetical protein
MHRRHHPRTPRAPASDRAPVTSPAHRPSPLIIGISATTVLIALIAAALALRSPASAAGGFSAVTDCRGWPQFAPEYGFQGGVIVNTSLSERTGLVLLDPAQAGRGFQHPSWTRAGNLGPFAADGAGNIYVGPVPRVSLAENPPAGANTIWRVDTQSAEMTPFVELPAAAEPNERNPFGILGLAYDCDTGSLYASSVAGSGPASEVGRLFQIDPATKQVVSQIEGIDALGLLVARTPEGKRLYYGTAREGLVSSIALDERGAFVGEPRQEIDLADLGGDVNEKARRLDLDGNTLKITVVPFTFTLAARSDDLQRHLVARYDAAARAWVAATAP